MVTKVAVAGSGQRRWRARRTENAMTATSTPNPRSFHPQSRKHHLFLNTIRYNRDKDCCFPGRRTKKQSTQQEQTSKNAFFLLVPTQTQARQHDSTLPTTTQQDIRENKCEREGGENGGEKGGSC